MATPVLTLMNTGRVERWNIEYSPRWAGDRDARTAALEALGRLTAGVSAWLALADSADAEGHLRSRLRTQLVSAIEHSVDPEHANYLNWRAGSQPLVDAAFLAHGLLRSELRLWRELAPVTRQRLTAELTQLRRLDGFTNNWVLFAAMIETFLAVTGQPAELPRIDQAVDKIEQWYQGDGIYGDGPEFHNDYYNAYVIQPMLVDILAHMGTIDPNYRGRHQTALDRMRRYAVVLERSISPEGTYPIIGRSSTYRTAVFQPLTQLALNGLLPDTITNGQLRCALDAVMTRQLDHPHTYDDAGWLTLGAIGHQPDITDSYSNTGSMYLASVVFLPLGLAPDHPFWTDADQDWTMKRAWAGSTIPIDHALGS